MAKATRSGGRGRAGVSERSGDATSVKLTVRLPANLVTRARHYAIDAHLSVQDVVAQALAWFLAQRPRPGRPVKRP